MYRVCCPVGARTRVVSVGWRDSRHEPVRRIIIAVGLRITASGRHFGDIEAGRTGFDDELLERLPAWPASVMLVRTIVLFAASVACVWLAGWVGDETLLDHPGVGHVGGFGAVDVNLTVHVA